uniref:Uncharacterized protein n=1 Tax=Cannabis sativa TaxID=3483 RepID=A0A803Q0V5_CANSA
MLFFFADRCCQPVPHPPSTPAPKFSPRNQHQSSHPTSKSKGSWPPLSTIFEAHRGFQLSCSTAVDFGVRQRHRSVQGFDFFV